MNIALFTYSTQPRGSVVHTWELAEALIGLGHRVCVYALDKDGRGCDRPLSSRLQLIPAQPAPNEINALIQQRIQEFVDFLKTETEVFDIYHAQDCIGANALLQLRDAGKIPHVVRTVHHVEDFQSPYLQQCQEDSIRRPDLCLCVSDRWQQFLQVSYGIAAARVINGVDSRRFSAIPTGQERALKVAYGLSGHPIYLTVGGIEPRKNSIRLLIAFADVLKAQPEAQLVIAGGATLFDYQSYRDDFFRTAAALEVEIGRSLLLPGVIPDDELPVLYRCADAFCFPSVKEGWGLVVLEAIAAGLPVLTADQPPFTEFLAAEQALFVAPDSVEALAAGMQTIATPERSQQLVRNSQTVLSAYTWARSAQMHIEGYQQLSL